MIPRETINKAIDFIVTHLTKNISVEDVASFCGYSKFYFCREFKEYTGQSVYSFIKRMRVEQCALHLKVSPHRTISDICLDYGLSSSNFATLFKDEKNISPYYYRKKIADSSFSSPFFHGEKPSSGSYEECNGNVSIEILPDYFVIYERRIGNYHDMSSDWYVFLEKYKAYNDGKHYCFERTFNDPSASNEDSCLYDLCIEADRDCPLENTCTLPGGKFAVYHFKGEHKYIYAAYQLMFNVWFPARGIPIDNRPGFDRYRFVSDDCTYMEIDLCFPIL